MLNILTLVCMCFHSSHRNIALLQSKKASMNHLSSYIIYTVQMCITIWCRLHAETEYAKYLHYSLINRNEHKELCFSLTTSKNNYQKRNLNYQYTKWQYSPFHSVKSESQLGCTDTPEPASTLVVCFANDERYKGSLFLWIFFNISYKIKYSLGNKLIKAIKVFWERINIYLSFSSKANGLIYWSP